MRLICLMLLFCIFPQSDPFQAQREQMVRSQIEARGISNPLVLEAFRKVPRHLLVPESVRSRAYQDSPLPIGDGQTISQPYMVALMTEVIDPKPSMKVLEIGTGSGYQAAILGEIVKEVYTIEIMPTLGQRAKEDLKNLGYENVFVKIGDGYAGWPEKAPFDAIIVTAAPESVPKPLEEQLAEGGKMVIPVGKQGFVQQLLLLEKKDGKIIRRKISDVRFVPFLRDNKQ